MEVKFQLNGEQVEVEIEEGELLIDTLRERLKIKSVKHGCGIGECGTCIVLVDLKPVCSCLLLTKSVENKTITTVEGIDNEKLKKSFVIHGAVQCGFCTPGMLLSAYSLLLENKNPTKEEIKERISGNLCRCTGYNQIIEAIEDVCKN